MFGKLNVKSDWLKHKAYVGRGVASRVSEEFKLYFVALRNLTIFK